MTDSKLIVVIGVLTTVFIGLAIYLFILDRKIANLQNQVKQRQEKQ